MTKLLPKQNSLNVEQDLNARFKRLLKTNKFTDICFAGDTANRHHKDFDKQFDGEFHIYTAQLISSDAIKSAVDKNLMDKKGVSTKFQGVNKIELKREFVSDILDRPFIRKAFINMLSELKSVYLDNTEKLKNFEKEFGQQHAYIQPAFYGNDLNYTSLLGRGIMLKNDTATNLANKLETLFVESFPNALEWRQSEWDRFKKIGILQDEVGKNHYFEGNGRHGEESSNINFEITDKLLFSAEVQKGYKAFIKEAKTIIKGILPEQNKVTDDLQKVFEKALGKFSFVYNEEKGTETRFTSVLNPKTATKSELFIKRLAVNIAEQGSEELKPLTKHLGLDKTSGGLLQSLQTARNFGMVSESAADEAFKKIKSNQNEDLIAVIKESSVFKKPEDQTITFIFPQEFIKKVLELKPNKELAELIEKSRVEANDLGGRINPNRGRSIAE